MADRLKYSDFLNDLYNDESYGVFIDETGVPDKQDKKTWVAVIIKPEIMSDVLYAIKRVISESEVFLEIPMNELHFGEIYNGKGKYRGIPFDKRLVLFKVMVDLFKHYNLPVIVQSMTPELLQQFEELKKKGIRKIGPFDLENYNDMGLFLLLFKIKEYILENRMNPSELARVFIDEDYKKNGIGILLPSYEDVFLNSGIFFCDSNAIQPIQLADFAAFCLNRTQLIINSSKPHVRDIKLAKILSPLAEHYHNIEKIEALILLKKIEEDGDIS